MICIPVNTRCMALGRRGVVLLATECVAHRAAGFCPVTWSCGNVQLHHAVWFAYGKGREADARDHRQWLQHLRGSECAAPSP